MTVVDLPGAIVIHVDGVPFVYVTDLQGMLPAVPQLGYDALALVGATIAQWDRYPEIGTQDTFLVSAKSALAREQFPYAVIELQTSFEVFIRNTHRFILLEQGAPEGEVAKAMTIPFRSVIEDHLARLLGIDLKFMTPGVIKEWHDKLYRLRNEIVHSGRSQVSGAEAHAAFGAYAAARGFLAERMAERGFLTPEGRIDLTVFRPSNTSPEADRAIFAQLQRKGLLPPEAKYEDIERW